MRWKIIAVTILALCAPAAAQQESRPGVGVDPHGNAVIDPTENVKALNAADAKRQDGLRDKDFAFLNYKIEAEARRIADLAKQKQDFDFELARNLKANSDEASKLLATQLAEVKHDLSNQISKVDQNLADRLTLIERWRYENSGASAGRGDVIGWIVGGVMLFVGLGGMGIAFATLRQSRAAR